MARRSSNPFDPYGGRDPYGNQGGSYIPQQFGMNDPNPTGIPDTSGGGSYLGGSPTFNESTGEYGLPGGSNKGGINPGGMYSGSGTPTTGIPSMPGGTGQTGRSIIEQLQAKYPATPQGYQALINDPLFAQSGYQSSPRGISDIIVGPDGQMIDIRTSGNTWWWSPVDEAARSESSSTYQSSSPLTGGGQFGEDVRNRILGLMGQTNDPTASPTYRNAVNAYDTQQQRGMERERNAIAERMAASGQANSGAMDSRIIGAEQARGENTANFAGQLAVRQLEQQRNEIMQALQLGAGLLSDDQRLALQDKLGLIDAGLQQQSIDNQNAQFTSNLGWEMAKWPSTQDWMFQQYGQSGA